MATPNGGGPSNEPKQDQDNAHDAGKAADIPPVKTKSTGLSKPSEGPKSPVASPPYAGKTIIESLIEAARTGRNDIIASILQRRAETKASGKFNETSSIDDDVITTALFNAISNGKLETAKILAGEKGIRLRNSHPPLHRTVLHEAVSKDDFDDIVTKLLGLPGSFKCVDIKDAAGKTAFHEAASRGNIKMMKTLLKNRADIDMPDLFHRSPLHGAVRKKAVDTFKFLVDHGAEVNTKDYLGNSPLHHASEAVNETLMKLLLESGADPECRNFEGETPQDCLPKTDIGRNVKRKIFFVPRAKWRPELAPQLLKQRPHCPKGKQRVCEEFFVTVTYYWRLEALSWSQTVSVYSILYHKDTLKRLEDEFVEIIRGDLRKKAKKELNPKSPHVEQSQPAVDRSDVWKWIHLPANNMTWIKDLIWRVTSSPGGGGQRVQAMRFLQRNIRERKGSRRDGNCTRMHHVQDSWRDDSETEIDGKNPPAPEKDNPSAIPRLGNEAWRNHSRFPRNRKLSLVIPYFDFETADYLARAEARERTRQFKWMTKLEDCYAPYTGLAGLQTSQTLDESYYDMLEPRELKERDRDQVIYKASRILGMFRETEEPTIRVRGPPAGTTEHLTYHSSSDDTRGGGGDSNEPLSPQVTTEVSSPTTMFGSSVFKYSPMGPPSAQSLSLPSHVGTRSSESSNPYLPAITDLGIEGDGHTEKVKQLLMIHQLWLLKIDDRTVITSCPERWHKGVEDDLPETIRQSRIDAFQKPEELIQHILHQCVTFLDEYRYAGLGDHVLNIFETCIAALSNQEVKCYKKFVREVSHGQNPDPRKSDDGEEARETDDIATEIRLIYEVKDIRDELHLIMRVFKNQSEVLDRFANLFWPRSGDDSSKNSQYREQFLDDCGIAAQIERTNRLDEDANRTLNALDYLVQIKQAQSSLKEAWAAGQLTKQAVEEAQRSKKLNNYIMLFTITTVIFTPLSFMTSLFAISINEFPHSPTNPSSPNSGDEIAYSSAWIAARMFVGELITLTVIGTVLYFLWVPSETRSDLFRRLKSFQVARSGDSFRPQQYMDSITDAVTGPATSKWRRPMSHHHTHHRDHRVEGEGTGRATRLTGALRRLRIGRGRGGGEVSGGGDEERDPKGEGGRGGAEEEEVRNVWLWKRELDGLEREAPPLRDKITHWQERTPPPPLTVPPSRKMTGVGAGVGFEIRPPETDLDM